MNILPQGLYSADSVKVEFGDKCVLKDKFFGHGQEVLVAQFQKEQPDGDGQPVDVYCSAYPAKFFRIVAHEGAAGDGMKTAGFVMRTGSDSGRLAKEIAEALSKGMLVLSSLQPSKNRPRHA